MGRKSTYTKEIGDRLCASLAEGEKSLRDICRELELKPSTVVTWANDNPKFGEQYARAREVGADLEFESLTDFMLQPPPKVKGYTDAAWVTWQRNAADVRKWVLARRQPKKYGEKLDLNHSGKITLESLILGSDE